MSAATTPSTIADGAEDRGVLLADALSVNAVTSGLTGAVLLLGAPWLDVLLGPPAAVLAGLGLGLVLFAATILVALARPSRLRAVAWGMVVADVVWVIGAAVVVAAAVLTPLGNILLGAVSVIVAGFAITQVAGLRRAREGDMIGTRPVELSASAEVAAAPAVAWALVADAAGYDAFAPGIARTTTDGALADGMVRTCVDDGGRTWSETCRMIQAGHSYRMQVDTTTYPLRYRLLLHEFAMTWRVTPTPDGGSRLELTFSGTTKLGVLGRLAMWALARDEPAEHIVDAYARELTPAG